MIRIFNYGTLVQFCATEFRAAYRNWLLSMLSNRQGVT